MCRLPMRVGLGQFLKQLGCDDSPISNLQALIQVLNKLYLKAA